MERLRPYLPTIVLTCAVLLVAGKLALTLYHVLLTLKF